MRTHIHTSLVIVYSAGVLVNRMVLTVWLCLGRAGLVCLGHIEPLALVLMLLFLSISTMATLRFTRSAYATKKP